MTTIIHRNHQTRLLLLFLLLFAPCLWAQAALNIRDFGAKGDGRTLDSPAINTAIDSCSRSGGGTVVIPAGTYLCGSIRLKSHTHLVLEDVKNKSVTNVVPRK